MMKNQYPINFVFLGEEDVRFNSPSWNYYMIPMVLSLKISRFLLIFSIDGQHLVQNKEIPSILQISLKKNSTNFELALMNIFLK